MLRKPFQNISFTLALLYLAVTIALAAISLWYLPFDPNTTVSGRLWDAPSAAHPLGIDGSGRDVFSRLLAGSRITVLVAVVTACGSAALSLLLVFFISRPNRLLAGLATVLIDVLIAFPTLLVALLLAAVFKPGLATLLTALSCGFAFSLSRILRGEVQQALRLDFVTAARAAGVSEWRIFWRHAVRYASPVLVTQTALVAGLAPLAESSLTYLGFGVNPQTPSLGAMLAQGQQAAGSHPLHVLWPGLALLLFALSCFTVGDALRRWVDPRSRSTASAPRASKQRTPAQQLPQPQHTSQPAAPAPAGAAATTAAATTAAATTAAATTAAQPGAPAPGAAAGNTAAPALLEVRELTVKNGSVTLLGPLSFTVRQGQQLGIIGTSGSGKTLTALSIATLLPEHLTAHGSIRLGSTEVLQLDPAAAAALRGKRVSYVFQEPKLALDPLQKIWRQISAPLAAHYRLNRAARFAEATRLAELVHLDTKLLHRYPHQLSGGQRQRAALAAALAAEPEVLIADEITSSLDSTVAAKISVLLRDLARSQNLTLLYISHDLAQLARVVDEIIVISAGQLVEHGSTAALLATPQHPATKLLVAAARKEADDFTQ